MQKIIKEKEEAVIAVEAETILKTRASLKSQKSKGNNFNLYKMKNVFLILVALVGLGISANAQHPALGGGTGTSTDPYQITDTSHLRILADYVNAGNGLATNGKYYILLNDLDLSVYAAGEGWKPIGNNSSSTIQTMFQGKFDGNNKVVKNLTINRPTERYIGLFGYIFSMSTIENLGIENSNIIGKGYVGSLVGENDRSSISNCYVIGNIISGGDISVGGLVGENINNSTISNCYAAGNVSVTIYCVGGLVGNNQSSSIISNCYATGNVSGQDYVGGLVGYNLSSTIKNCVAANDSVVSTTNTTNINRICGKTSGTLQNNYALNTMKVIANGVEVTRTDDDTLNGTGKPLTDLQSLAFYATASNWADSAWSINDPSGVWKICDGENRFPFLRWQGIVCTPTAYTITATAGTGGSINPSGNITVNAGTDQTFTFSANSGYEISQVLIDNLNNFPAVTAGSYTFTNVQANHKIEVYFKTTVGIVGTQLIASLPRIYPNPTSGQLIIASPNPSKGGEQATIEIYNVVGQVVFTSQLSKLSPETTIDISHLASGLYFLKVNGKMVKIVKE